MGVEYLEVGLMVLSPRVASSENPLRPLGHLTKIENIKHIDHVNLLI